MTNETLVVLREAFEAMDRRRNEYGIKMLVIGLLGGFIIGVVYTFATLAL